MGYVRHGVGLLKAVSKRYVPMGIFRSRRALKLNAPLAIKEMGGKVLLLQLDHFSMHYHASSICRKFAPHLLSSRAAAQLFT
jgi:hypothetical protein